MLVDSGATSHIATEESMFVKFDETFTPTKHTVELADGRKESFAEKRGKISIEVEDSRGNLCSMSLSKVLYCPTFPQNIFSVKSATVADEGSRVVLDSQGGDLITSDGTIFPIKAENGLYILKNHREVEEVVRSCKPSNTKATSIEEWHRILGHINIKDIERLEKVVEDMKITNKSKEFICEVCPLSKPVVHYNRQPDERATSPLQFVHSDLAGPINPVAKGGFRFVINFIDDFTGACFVYFLKVKADASNALEKFLCDIAPYGKVNYITTRFRSDNGGEFIANDFEKVLIKNNIRHEFSAPYSPHQNGTAERNWRSLFEMARAMIIGSQLPKSLWTYAVMTAAHVRNRVFCQRIKDTPYHMLTGRKPKLGRLHIFGTVCTSYNHEEKQKLDERGRKGIFVGYDKYSPSYLVYFEESKQVRKCGTVEFMNKYKQELQNLRNTHAQAHEKAGPSNTITHDESPFDVMISFYGGDQKMSEPDRVQKKTSSTEEKEGKRVPEKKVQEDQTQVESNDEPPLLGNQVDVERRETERNERIRENENEYKEIQDNDEEIEGNDEEIQENDEEIERNDEEIQENNNEIQENDEVHENQNRKMRQEQGIIHEDQVRPRRNRRMPQHIEKDYITDIDNIFMIASTKLPKTYSQAVKSENSSEWMEAMEKEMESMKNNKVYTVVQLPEGKKVVGSRWVYNIKDNPSGQETYKARFVAKGYSQQEGEDYKDTYSPTAKMTTVRLLLQVSVENNLTVHQLDVRTAYLNADIDCEVFIKQPEGFEVGGKNQVWKLRKSLYGLKQSGRNWNLVLSQYLRRIGFKQSRVDVCLFYMNEDPRIAYIVVWVDDILLAANTIHLLQEIKNKLEDEFNMKDIGPISYFLGIEFKQTSNDISMCQTYYLKNILRKFKMEDCKPRNTPCEVNLDVYRSNNDSLQEESLGGSYREIVGSLVYAMTCSRPDLAWVVTKLSQHLANPSPADWMTIRHVLRYIKATIDYKLVFKKSNEGLQISCYSDSDWASEKEDRRSTTGYAFTLNREGPVIAWKSKKQHTVALSSCEAEYMALTHTTQELLFLAMLCRDFNINNKHPMTIRGDNQGSLDMVRNPVSNDRSKHIDIKHHFIRDNYSNGIIDVKYVPTGENLADLFTKAVTKQKLRKFHGHLFG